MGSRPCAFTESDVRKAVKAIKAAGEPVKKVVFNADGFEVIIGSAEKTQGEEPSTWDDVHK